MAITASNLLVDIYADFQVQKKKAAHSAKSLLSGLAPVPYWRDTINTYDQERMVNSTVIFQEGKM